MRLWQTCTKLFVSPQMSIATAIFCGACALSRALSSSSIGMFVLAYGSWWALPFLAAAAARFFVGYRIYQATKPASRRDESADLKAA